MILREQLDQFEEAFKRLGYREDIPSSVENILIVRLDVIGDMVITSGFIREVRANFPTAQITLVVSPLVFPIVELCPYVNEILVFDKNKLDRNILPMFESLISFCREHLWQKHFSVAFSPQWDSDNLPALLMCWLSGARKRVGYGISPLKNWGIEPLPENEAFNNFLLTDNIMAPREFISEVEKCFYLLQAVGLEVSQDNLELFFDKADISRANELLKDIPSTSKKIVIGIGAGLKSRQYPVEKLLIALKELAQRDFVFVIVGGKSELEDANFIEQNLPTGKVLNLVDKTTLRETEAVISQMDYYIGNDSGVMHMAATEKIPCLVFYREAYDKEDYLPGVYSELRRFPPWQTKSVTLRPDHQLEECAKQPPVYGWCHAEEPHCITQITPQEIIDGFKILEDL